jgi:hypothetical protein
MRLGWLAWAAFYCNKKPTDFLGSRPIQDIRTQTQCALPFQNSPIVIRFLFTHTIVRNSSSFSEDITSHPQSQFANTDVDLYSGASVSTMRRKSKLERLERRVDESYAVCEKIAVRTLLFGCFIVELSRFVVWLFR